MSPDVNLVPIKVYFYLTEKVKRENFNKYFLGEEYF